jgi:hypothetical protein
MFNTAQVNKNLKDMMVELLATKNSAKYLLNKIADGMPEQFMGAGNGGNMSTEDESNLGGGADMGGAPPTEDEGQGAPPEGLGEEKKEKEIKTPEEAKKVVNEAITDLKAVVDGIDSITGQGEEMTEKTESKTARFSSKMQQEFGLLTRQASSAIDDARSAIRHWAYLLKRKNSASIAPNATSHDIVKNVQEGVRVWRELGAVLGTAVPPTGAEFSGDKGINGDINYSARKEIKNFQAGNEEFHKNKAKEDRMPNPSSEPRLLDEGNPHEFGAYVNAKIVQKTPVFGSAIVMRTLNKEGHGRYAVATWESLSNAVGPKTAANYEIFTSPAFAKNVEDHMRKNGIEAVAAYLNAEVDSIGLQTTAREPKVKDKAKLRAYYADAYGDKEFARELTSVQKQGADLGMGINQDKANAVTKGGVDMNIAYKPEADSANAEEGGLEGGNKADSVGSGKVDTKASLEVRQARARAAVDFARLAASRNVIPFTKIAIATKAREVVEYPESKFSAQKELLESMPITNEAALKEARIPENEEVQSGIVANTREAVREPKNTSVSTEGLKSEVKTEAKVTQAGVVPQMQATSALSKEPFTAKMSTISNRLRAQGLNPETEPFRTVRPHYRPKVA